MRGEGGGAYFLGKYTPMLDSDGYSRDWRSNFK